MIIAMVAGILTNIFDKDKKYIHINHKTLRVDTGSTPTFSTFKPVGADSISALNNKEEESCGAGTGSCCSSTSTDDEKKGFSFMLR